jgi:hypothetical protein
MPPVATSTAVHVKARNAASAAARARRVRQSAVPFIHERIYGVAVGFGSALRGSFASRFAACHANAAATTDIWTMSSR